MSSGAIAHEALIPARAPGSVIELLRERALAGDGGVLYRFLDDHHDEGRLLGWTGLDRRACAVAARLRGLGNPGDRALIVHPPGLEYIAALFGCWYAGIIPVPAYPPRWNRPDGRLAGLARDSGARFALTTGAWLDRLQSRAAGPGDLPPVEWLATDRVGDEDGAGFEPRTPSPGDVALLQYTSGSTSAPKGVVVTHACFLSNVDAIVSRRGLGPADRVVSWLPPYHDMGLVAGIVMPACTGMEATLLSPAAFLQRPHTWLGAIARFGGTVSGGPNFAYDLCVRRVSEAQRAALDLSSWTTAFSGAERVRPETLERFANAFSQSGFRRSALAPCYGLAEATLCVSIDPPGSRPMVARVDPESLGRGIARAPAPGAPAATLAACGAPVKGLEVTVVHPETRRRMPDDAVGELWIRGDSVGAGYWGRPEVTEATFRATLAGDAGGGPRYLRTGDLGFLRGGEVYVTGRLKDLIILAGRNHYPDDIEATIQGCDPRLRAAGAAAFSVEIDGEEALVVVQEVADPREVDEASAAAMAAAIRAAIAEEHELRVHEVVLVPPGGVPKTSSGKVQRSASRQRYLDGALEALARIPATTLPDRTLAPRPETIARVAALMAEVLGEADVRPEDDFFSLGGHSLMATQLVSRVREVLGVELPLRAVFEEPTACALAARIEASPRRGPPEPIERVDRTGRLPLSFSQERMWFLHQLDPSSAAYNVAGALVIEGPLDLRALEGALALAFERHEVLRSTYPTIDGEPHVRIGPAPPLHLEPIDLSGRADADGVALEQVSALAHRPFDLSLGLVRIVLYRTAVDRHVFGISMHHLVTDGWSMGVLTREVFEAYAALAAGHPPPRWPPMDVEYVDYAAWQRRRLSRDALKADLAYWKGALSGVQPLELPADRPREGHRSPAGAVEPLHLPATLRAAVRDLAVAHGATPFMVMLAAFHGVLARHAGQWDFAVGVPIANRHHLPSEHLLGTLVNTLPVRIESDPEISFAELLGRVRRASIDAYAHQDLPFERLVSEVPVERRSGQSPIVQVMFDYQNAPMPGQKVAGLRVRPALIERGAAQFDVSLVVLDGDLGHTAVMEYSTALFDATTVRRLLDHFVALLEQAARDATRPIGRVAIVGAEERARLLALAEGPFDVGPADRSPAALFEAHAAATPGATAVSDPAGSVSYRELDLRASAIARRLAELGAGPGDRVAVLLDRSREIVAALLAVHKVGAAYVPIDHRYPSSRVSLVLEDSTPAVVLTEHGLRHLVPEPLASRVLAVEDVAPLPGGHPPVTSPPFERGRPAYVLYTSGSTGRPKGVVVSVGALSNFLRSMARTPGMTADDRLLSVTTIAFDISGLELWLPLVTGASVHLAPDDAIADGARLRDLVERVSPTVMQATPATWRLLLEAGWQGDRRVRVLCGGEAFPRDLADRLLAIAGPVWNVYGPTETTIWSTIHRVEPGPGAVPIGRPIDRTRVYVLDRSRALAPLGVPGEIAIGGDGVAEGYHGRADLTAERFVHDPFAPEAGARMYLTGDLGRLRPDGTFEHLGRLDHQIKLRGFRIEPAEIESALKEAGARDAVAIARAHGPGDVRLVGYYVSGEATPAPSELRERLRGKLPAYMVPWALVPLDALPRTPNGKVDRAALPAPDATEAAGEPHVPPRDATERSLVRLFEETLGVPAPSVRADFFSLGGHSLLAVRLLARIRRDLAVDLPLRTLLDDPTIEGLAARVREAAAHVVPTYEGFEHLVPIRPGRGEPLVCVHGAGGNVLNMERIARHARLSRPFVAFQARGTDGIATPLPSIEAMAEAYLRELRAVQPEGPYFLSGYCGGGLVAFEMATRLQRAGQEVALLVLVDAYRPGSFSMPRYRRLARRVRADGPGYLLRRAGHALERDLGVAARDAAIAWYRARGRPVPHERRDDWLTRSFLAAAAKYRPGVFQGRLTILRATELDFDPREVEVDLGWRGHATDGVEVLDVPGHHDLLSEEPHVAVLGATLRGCVERAEARRG